jgi:formate-dependent phosphoribosylglycinamide formyltransferase (GAR transformylase)
VYKSEGAKHGPVEAIGREELLEKLGQAAKLAMSVAICKTVEHIRAVARRVGLPCVVEFAAASTTTGP